MNNFWVICAIISMGWTGFAASYTMMWVVRQISIETDAVHVVPDKTTDFYLFNWQTWEGSDLFRYITRKYWTYFVPAIISFCVTAFLIFMGAR